MTETELEKLNSGRLLRDASQHLLPLLQEMKDAVISRIIMAHREPAQSGHTLGACAAELSAIETLRTKINRNNNETARREEQFHERPDVD